MHLNYGQPLSKIAAWCRSGGGAVQRAQAQGAANRPARQIVTRLRA